MVKGRQRDQWNRTAAAMCLLANIHRDRKKGRKFGLKDFHPLAREAERDKPVAKVSIKSLKVFLGPSKKRKVQRGDRQGRPSRS